MKIHVVSGAIASGKSSYLLKKSQKLEDIDGIITLCPNRINRIYYFYFISKNKLLEACRYEGKMLFNEENFLYANNYLKNISSKNIIIDEIGHLELRETGFFNSLRYILDEKEAQNLFLSLRYDIFSSLIYKFNLNKYDFSSKILQ